MLKIGVLGCAQIAQRSVIPAIEEVSGLELVAVASRSLEKAQEFASLFNCEPIEGYQTLIDRPDIQAIYMPLPTGIHEEWVTKALLAGKHLLVEKSLAIDFSSAKKMVDLAQQRNLLLMENFMFVHHKQHQIVRELIEKGEIGELRSFRSSFGFPPLDSNNFRYSKSLGGGSLLDAAAYTVKASQLFLGPALEVAAASLNYSNSSVDLFGGAFLKAPNGLFAEVAFGFDNFYQCNYELWGSTGKITAHRAFTPKPDFKPTITLEQSTGISNIEAPADNHFVNILEEFVRCINGNLLTPKYNDVLNQSRLLNEIRAQSSGN
jgi:predicted dehydrogenase